MSKRIPTWLLLALLTGSSSIASADNFGEPEKIVFIGGVGSLYATLADPAVSAPMLQTGKIGLYQHANGNALLTPGQRSALWAMWHAREEKPTQTVGEVGGSAVDDSGYVQLFGGSYPSQVNMNTLTDSGDGTGSYQASAGETEPGRVYNGYATAADLAVMQREVCEAVRHGAKNVAIVMTPNGGGEDLSDGFDNAVFWAHVRAAALFGGGIGLDVPPTYWVLRGVSYQTQVAHMIAWANSQGIRSSLIVSPHAEKPDADGHTGGCGYDPAFMTNTRRLAESLVAASALPTQWIVENYGAAGPSCGTGNDVAAGDKLESLNAIALYLAASAPVSPHVHIGQQALMNCRYRN